MLKQEIGWFDKNENHVGVLVTKLAVEVNNSLNNIFIQSIKKINFLINLIFLYFLTYIILNFKADPFFIVMPIYSDPT
jgi:hypothetical protein